MQETQYIMGSLDHPRQHYMQETQYIMGSLDHPRQQSFPLYSSTGQEYKTSCVLRWSTSLAMKLLLICCSGLSDSDKAFT